LKFWNRVIHFQELIERYNAKINRTGWIEKTIWIKFKMDWVTIWIKIKWIDRPCGKYQSWGFRGQWRPCSCRAPQCWRSRRWCWRKRSERFQFYLKLKFFWFNFENVTFSIRNWKCYFFYSKLKMLLFLFEIKNVTFSIRNWKRMLFLFNRNHLNLKFLHYQCMKNMLLCPEYFSFLFYHKSNMISY